MLTSAPDAGQRVKDVRFDEDHLIVDLMDGRSLSTPLAWYPRLLNSTLSQRETWEIAGGGFGIRWPEIDEHMDALPDDQGRRPLTDSNEVDPRAGGQARQLRHGQADVSRQTTNQMRAWAMALDVAYMAAGGAALGYALDRWAFGTLPWLTMGLTLGGLVAGLTRFVRAANALNRSYSSRSDETPKP